MAPSAHPAEPLIKPRHMQAAVQSRPRRGPLDGYEQGPGFDAKWELVRVPGLKWVTQVHGGRRGW